MDENEKAILDFIRGVGHRWGQGITLHKRDESSESLAKWRDCLSLERQGLIQRLHESDSVVVFVPAVQEVN